MIGLPLPGTWMQPVTRPSEAMSAPLRQSFHLSMRGHRLRGHTPEATIAAHERVVDRVKAGDGRGAAQAMRLHLRESERDIRAAQNSSLDRQPAPLAAPTRARRNTA